MLPKRAKKSNKPGRDRPSLQQIVFIIIALLIIASFVISLVSF